MRSRESDPDLNALSQNTVTIFVIPRRWIIAIVVVIGIVMANIVIGVSAYAVFAGSNKQSDYQLGEFFSQEPIAINTFIPFKETLQPTDAVRDPVCHAIIEPQSGLRRTSFQKVAG